MASTATALTPDSFTRFGDILRFLRRRAQLTQRELSVAVGYNFAQICRLEGGQRLPDPTVVAATFVPALYLEDEPAWATRLIALATTARQDRHEAELTALAPAIEPAIRSAHIHLVETLEAVPEVAPHEIARPQMVVRLHARLVAERCVALCGLAGMGKTTLAAALAREYAETTPVFWLTFSAGVTTSVEALLRQLATFTLEHMPNLDQPLLRRVSEGDSILPLDRQLGAITAALAQLDKRITGRRATPPLLCFDNIHLIQDDDAIIRVLRHIMATSSARLLLTSREHVTSLPGCAQVRLGGLEHAEGMELVARLTAHQESPEKQSWVTKLLEKTGSSPMLVRLAVGQLLDERAAPDVFIEQLASQPQIASYLLETVRRHMSAQSWWLLSLIAVFRQPINLHDPALIELIQGADRAGDLATTLTELTRYHLIDHPAHAQPHPLVRDYAYSASITQPAQRRHLHRIAAEWSEHGLDDAIEASYHAYMTQDLAGAFAILAYHVETLSQRGKSFAAADMAALVLAQARRQGSDRLIVRGLLTLRGDLLIHTVRAEEAEASYRAALALTDDPARRAQIAHSLARSLNQRGQALEAVELCQQTAAALDPGATELLASLAAAESEAHLVLTNYDQAIVSAERALALVDLMGGAQTWLAAEIRAHAHKTLGVVLRIREQLDAAFEHIQSAIRYAQDANLPDLTLHCQLDAAELMFWQGKFIALLARCAEIMPQLESSGDSYGSGKLWGLSALSHLLCGEPLLGLAAAEQSVRARTETGDRHGLTNALNQQALMLITLDRLNEARTVVDRALAASEASGVTIDAGYTLEKLAMIQMLEGDAAAARTTLARALALPGVDNFSKLQSDLLMDQAVALLMTGAFDDAHQLITNHAMSGGLWVELEYQVLEGMIAVARGDTTSAQRIATTLAARATQADVRLFSWRAAQLEASIADTPPHDWPRLMWVMETCDIISATSTSIAQGNAGAGKPKTLFQTL